MVSDKMTFSVYEEQVQISIEENLEEKEDEDERKKASDLIPRYPVFSAYIHAFAHRMRLLIPRFKHFL